MSCFIVLCFLGRRIIPVNIQYKKNTTLPWMVTGCERVGHCLLSCLHSFVFVTTLIGTNVSTHPLKLASASIHLPLKHADIYTCKHTNKPLRQQDMASPGLKPRSVFLGTGHSRARWGTRSSSVAKWPLVQNIQKYTQDAFQSSCLKCWNESGCSTTLQSENEKEGRWAVTRPPGLSGPSLLTGVNTRPASSIQPDTQLLDGRKHMDSRTIDGGRGLKEKHVYTERHHMPIVFCSFKPCFADQPLLLLVFIWYSIFLVKHTVHFSTQQWLCVCYWRENLGCYFMVQRKKKRKTCSEPHEHITLFVVFL